MTYEQYWYGDVWMVRAYRNADIQRQKRHNNESWLQGLYIWDAVSKAVSNLSLKKGQQPLEYVKEPFDIFGDKEKRKEETEEQEALRAKIYMRQMERAGRDWGKK